MRIKKGVRLLGMRPEILLAVTIAESVLPKFGQEVVITSTSDSKHSRNSRHYIGCGVDLRSREVPENSRNDAVAELADRLGPEFYVAFEVNHFHIQFNGSPDGT